MLLDRTIGKAGTVAVGEFSPEGKLLTYWGVQGTAPGYMNAPHAFSADPEGNLYMANGLNHRVEKFVPKPGADKSRLVGQPYAANASTKTAASR